MAEGSVLDTLVFDATKGLAPKTAHISGDIYAIAYAGPNLDGRLASVGIDDAANIGSVIDSLEFDATMGAHVDMLHVSGDAYAIACQGVSEDGWLETYPWRASWPGLRDEHCVACRARLACRED